MHIPCFPDNRRINEFICILYVILIAANKSQPVGPVTCDDPYLSDVSVGNKVPCTSNFTGTAFEIDSDLI